MFCFGVSLDLSRGVRVDIMTPLVPSSSLSGTRKPLHLAYFLSSLHSLPRHPSRPCSHRAVLICSMCVSLLGRILAERALPLCGDMCPVYCCWGPELTQHGGVWMAPCCRVSTWFSVVSYTCGLSQGGHPPLCHPSSLQQCTLPLPDTSVPGLRSRILDHFRARVSPWALTPDSRHLRLEVGGQASEAGASGNVRPRTGGRDRKAERDLLCSQSACWA